MTRSRPNGGAAITALLLAACAADAEPDPPACIAEGGRVRTPQGPTPIESLRVGSLVVSMNPDTGELATSRVVRIVSAVRECVALRFGSTTLVCTPSHPIYDPVARVYAPASEWVEGRRTSLLDHERCRRSIDAVDLDAGLHRVFDITVEHPLHDFFVEGVLVHNKSPPQPDWYSTGEVDTEGDTDTTGGMDTSSDATTDGSWSGTGWVSSSGVGSDDSSGSGSSGLSSSGSSSGSADPRG